MSAIPLARGAFKRGNGPQMRLVNMLFEPNPLSGQDQVSLIQRPGLAPYADCGDGPIRGIFHRAGSNGAFLFVVSGSELFRVTTAANVFSIVGTVGGGFGRVAIAGGAATAGDPDEKIMIATGTALYCADTLTVDLTPLPGALGASSVAFLAGRFLVAAAGTQKVFYTDVAGLSFSELDFFSAEFAPDDVVSINVLGDSAYLFGEESIEIWTATGDSDAPFMRVRGRLFDLGLASRDTVQPLDNTLFWVGNDRAVYRMENVPVRVSDAGVEARLRGVDPGALRAWACKLEGHLLYVLTTGVETLVLDVSTGQWSEFSSDGAVHFRAHLGAERDGVTYGADAFAPRLLRFDETLARDLDRPIVREWSGFVDVEGERARCDRVRLGCSVGTGPLDGDVLVSMRVSDDGRRWSDWLDAPLGREGEFSNRVAWSRLGLIRPPGRFFHWRTSADCKVTIRNARLNERL